MKYKIILVICAVLVKSVQCACKHSNCAEEIVKDILKDTSVIENIDIKLEVPKFQQIKNVGIEDLNQILMHLTSWFESRLNETSFIFKHVNNKTNLFVKRFDFNVDFDKGNAKIDVDLTEDQDDTTKIEKPKVPQKVIHSKVIKTTTPKPKTEPTKPVKNTKTLENKTDKIDVMINKLASFKDNDVLKIGEFDTSYYDTNEDNSTDYPILDYVDIYKDTTNEEYVYSSTQGSQAIKDIITGIYDPDTPHNSTQASFRDHTSSSDPFCENDVGCKDFSKTVFPWIVTIFITNNSKESQFSYHCDGALLSDKVIITDARCLIIANKSWQPEDVLVFLGKGNLQTFGGNEKVHKIKEIIIHPNYTVNDDGTASNALALLVTEDTVEFKTNIQAACFHQDWRENGDEAATTAWGLNGTLIPIIFNKNKSDDCLDRDEGVFCATYGNEVALCPSYGGIYAIRKGYSWCLQGIFHGDPADRGICFTKHVLYTALKRHMKWIDDTVDSNKNDILYAFVLLDTKIDLTAME